MHLPNLGRVVAPRQHKVSDMVLGRDFLDAGDEAAKGEEEEDVSSTRACKAAQAPRTVAATCASLLRAQADRSAARCEGNSRSPPA